jgi:CRP/FNR family transcriptional regulator, cyclic AMP receptor protein
MNLSLLRNTALFADLDEAQLGRVADLCQEQTYRSGETIFREGEPGNRLFIIVTGSVRISRDIPNAGEEALAVLKPGTCFGEMSVLDRSERSTDAFAADDCVLATITRPDLEMLLEFDKELAYVVLRSFVRMLSGRLRATNDSLRTFLAMSMF